MTRKQDKTRKKDKEKNTGSSRPRVALVTNHGYPAPELPIGGAPDTGGQNVYVHNLAEALEALGFDVTIFARGGFPHFGSDRLREGTEPLTEHIRYVYVPGGGNEFLRKEDISVALDEEVDWIEAYLDEQAEAEGVDPWEYFEFINTHYWDAAVIGVGLVQRWQHRIAGHHVAKLLEGVVPTALLDDFRAKSRWLAVASAPAYHLGRLLLETERGSGPFLKNAVKQAARNWARRHRKDPRPLVAEVERALSRARRTLAQELRQVVAAEALGMAMLNAKPKTTAKLRVRLNLADRHIWTPHSLGVLKEERFADRPLEERRPLRFCERRDHEFFVARNTRLFVATSLDIAERLVTHLGVPAERMFSFPPCVDTSVFRPYDEKELRKLYRYLADKTGLSTKILKSAKIVFETSRMDTSKRKDLLVKAFARVAPDHPEAVLLIGGGPENDVYRALQRLVEDLPGLSGRAFVLGYVPEEHIGPLFGRADLYVSPSEMEGFGMSVAQAAASGTAVVCTDTVPFAQHYAPTEAVMVPPGDEEGFAEAMARLLADDDKRRRLGWRLAERTKNLNWPAQTRLFLEYLRRQGIPVRISDRQLSKPSKKNRSKP